MTQVSQISKHLCFSHFIETTNCPTHIIAHVCSAVDMFFYPCCIFQSWIFVNEVSTNDGICFGLNMFVRQLPLLILKQAAVAPDLQLKSHTAFIISVSLMDLSQADLHLFDRPWGKRSVNPQVMREYIWLCSDKETKLLIERIFSEEWNYYFNPLITFYDW